MLIKGIQKLTLLDYPGKTACTLFTGGCNFRCPFCHNSELVLAPNDVESIPEDEVYAFLKKRRSLLDGVCITGGEPTLQSDLIEFIEKLKSFGYAVKLDTNGYEPEKLKKIMDSGMVDYIAMDIKSSPRNYARIAGIKELDFSRIERSVKLISNSSIEHEFRTTVVNQLHSKQDFIEIGRWLKGEERYFLQQFVNSGSVICGGMSAASEADMHEFLIAVREFIPNAQLRGMNE